MGALNIYLSPMMKAREKKIVGTKDNPPNRGIGPWCIFRLSGMSNSRLRKATTNMRGIMSRESNTEIANAVIINRYNIINVSVCIYKISSVPVGVDEKMTRKNDRFF